MYIYIYYIILYIHILYNTIYYALYIINYMYYIKYCIGLKPKLGTQNLHFGLYYPVIYIHYTYIYIYIYIYTHTYSYFEKLYKLYKDIIFSKRKINKIVK